MHALGGHEVGQHDRPLGIGPVASWFAGQQPAAEDAATASEPTRLALPLDMSLAVRAFRTDRCDDFPGLNLTAAALDRALLGF